MTSSIFRIILQTYAAMMTSKQALLLQTVL